MSKLPEAFITCNSDGQSERYYVEVKTKTLADAQVWHGVVLKLAAPAPAPAPALKQGDGWQDIATVPKDGPDVLVWLPADEETGYVAHAEIGICSLGSLQPRDNGGAWADGVEPTHWMHLPPRPTSSTGAKSADSGP